MKGVWVVIAIGLIGTLGCVDKPKREMRQTQHEELIGPPAGTVYDTPREADRTEAILQPKSNTPGLNTGAPPSLGGPGGPGGPSAGAKR